MKAYERFEFLRGEYIGPRSFSGMLLDRFGKENEDYRFIKPIKKNESEMMEVLQSFKISIKINKRFCEYNNE